MQFLMGCSLIEQIELFFRSVYYSQHKSTVDRWYFILERGLRNEPLADEKETFSRLLIF